MNLYQKSMCCPFLGMTAHRLRRRRGRLQDACHATTEVLRNAMAPPRRTGHLDAPRADTKFTLRPSVGVALRDLSSRGHRPRQRGGVSLQTCRMTNQCQSYTLWKQRSPYGAEQNYAQLSSKRDTKDALRADALLEAISEVAAIL